MASGTGESSGERPSVVATLAMLVGTVPFMAGLFGLYHLLGVGMPYFGFLFLLYWAAMMRQEPMQYLPSLLGALLGISLGWLLIALPGLVGPAGMVVSVGLLVIVLFCYMRGHGLIVVNNATMLFLTVATISELNIAGNVRMMAASVVVAAGYMGIVTLVMHLAARRFKRGKTDVVTVT